MSPSSLHRIVLLALMGVMAPPSAEAEETPPEPPSCAAPTPFEPDPPKREWRHFKNRIFTTRAGSPHHRAQDVVTTPGDPQRIAAKFTYGLVEDDLEGEDVSIWIHGDAPCGPWEKVGQARTSLGLGSIVHGVEDDGGRIWFELPSSAHLPPGRHQVRVMVRGDHSQARLFLHVVTPGTQAVVFDIDGTLTTRDQEIWEQVWGKVSHGIHTPDVRPGAVEVVKRWAAKGYLPIYVTGRPGGLLGMTRRWLRDMGFPPGPVRATEDLGEAMPNAMGVGRFKLNVLHHLSREVGLEIVAAYGNAQTDLWAYSVFGLRPERMFLFDEPGGKLGTVPLTDYRLHLPWVERVAPAIVPSPSFHTGW